MSENCLDIEVESTLIERIQYYPDEMELTVIFKKYYIKTITHINVPPDYFDEFVKAKSCGNFYLNHISKFFKTKTMADQSKKLPTKNRASSKKRFIKMRLNVNEINKLWMFHGEKGTYLDVTLQMLPDGKVDKYGNLGMITQDVPTDVYKKAKAENADPMPQGAILGNASEVDWDALNNGGNESTVGTGNTFDQMSDYEKQQAMDDLPF